MRSIRRSLLGYLLLLLAVSLGAVGLLVDRFANAAVRQRQTSEEERIKKIYEVREIEAKAKFDADLLAETKSLARDVHYKTLDFLGLRHDPRKGPSGPPRQWEPLPPAKAPDEVAKEYRLRLTLMQVMTPPSLPLVSTYSAMQPRLDVVQARPDGSPPRRSVSFPGWTEFDSPRAMNRLADALAKALSEEHPGGYFQITLMGTDANRSHRMIAQSHSTSLGESVFFDQKLFESTQESEPKLEDVELSGKGKFREVLTGNGIGGARFSFFLFLPAPSALTNPVPANYPIYSSFRANAGVRVYVQYLRPYSELDSRLAADQEQRNGDLTHVAEETRMELAQFRMRLILIGSGTFAALVLGGWFIVARGLSPLQKLSDAVSRVSEKDFRLPVVATELGHELAPIHERLTQTLTLLQRAFAREKQAVADISHELRTPIASLLATIDVALRKPRTPEQYRSALEECRLISKQLGQLVERIMTLASLDAGKDNTSVSLIDAGDLTGGCAAIIRPLAAANNISIAIQHDDELTLETDSGKLREVLMNLLHNAVEYNKPGGTIELAARRENTSVVFEVRDTGIGMTPEVMEKIFERFYRADASRHATGVHAGLGLAIVKEYVTRLNGAISVESVPGEGTVFQIRLPLAPSANCSNSPPIVPSSSDRLKMRGAIPSAS